MDPTPEPSSAPQSSPLEEVVDDRSPDLEAAIEWTSAELIRGVSFEDAAAQLTAGGWPVETAEEIVEAARQLTRSERGVVTREDVSRNATQRYRKTMANTRWWAFGGLPILLMAIRNLRILWRGTFGGEKKEQNEPRTK